MLRLLYDIIFQRRLYYYDHKHHCGNFFLSGNIFIGKPSNTVLSDIIPNYRYILYFDSDDSSSILQIDKWFEFGFLKKSSALIIFNQHRSVRKHYFKYLVDNEYNFAAICDYRNFLLPKGTIVFYVFNSITNPYVINSTDSHHIFIGHGESDKAASVNPMMKMYDAILVSGDIAKRRLVEHGIVASSDQERRIIRIGLPSVGPLFKSGKGALEKMETTLLYAPTWEGSLASQAYSSLDNDIALDALKLLLSNKQYKITTVIVKPHPSTGKRVDTYAAKLLSIYQSLKIDVDTTLCLSKSSHIYSLIKDQINYETEVTETIDYRDIQLMTVDVSSMTTFALHYEIPFALLHQRHNVATNNPSMVYEKFPLSKSAVNFIEDIGFIDQPVEDPLNVLLARLLTNKVDAIRREHWLENCSDNEELLELLIAKFQ